MKTASLIMGILSIFGMFLGFIPCLGALIGLIFLLLF